MASQASVVLQSAVAAAAKGGSSADDRELLRRFADGDQAAFALLVARHTGMVYGVCRRALGSAQDAEDACQATFLVLAKKARSGRWQPSVASWLYGTARRVARNARVVAARRARHEANAARDPVEPVDAMTGRELLAALDDELDKLSATYREPLVLCYLEGLSRDEAAQRLGVPAGTVKIRLERGRNKLGDALTQRGVVGGIGLLALAVTSPAGASPLRTVEAVLTAAAGTVPPAVAALVEGVAMTGIKTAVVTLVAAAFGFAALVAAKPLILADDAVPAAPAKVVNAPPVVAADEFAFVGRVLDPAGKPLAGAKVLVNGPREGVNQFVPMTTSGPDGSFRFTMNVATLPDKRKASLTVGAFADGFGAASAFANTPELRADLTVWLPPEEVATGRVIDPEGKPVPGVTLAASLRGGRIRKTGQPVAYDAEDDDGRNVQFVPDDPAREQATTGADGRFTIRGLSRDWLYDLDVWGPTVVKMKAQIDARRVPAKSGNTLMFPGRADVKIVCYGSAFDLVAAPCKPIAGTVREKGSGTPVVGAELRTTGNYLFPICFTKTDAQGRYTLTGLASGVHTLIVDPPANTPYIRGESQVDARTPGFAAVNHDIELSRLPFAQGRVTDARTGRPVAGSVEYRPLAANRALETNPLFKGPMLTARGPQVQLDANGRYSLPVLPGGGALIVAAVGNYVPAELAAADRKADVVCPQDGELLDTRPLPLWPAQVEAYRRIDVTDGKDLAVDFILAPARRRMLTVTFPDGIAKAVSVYGIAAPARADGATAYVAGKTAIERLTAGEVRRVYASTHDGSLAGFLDVNGNDESAVELPLQPTAAVAGRVLDANGRPVVGVGFVVAYDGGPGQPDVAIHGAYMTRRSRPRDYLVTGYNEMRDAAASSANSKTNDRGEFRLDRIVPGLAFDLYAARYSPPDKQGRQSFLGLVKLTRTTVKAGDALALGDLLLQLPGNAKADDSADEWTFTGRVLDAAGKPFAGAKVLVNGPSPDVTKFVPMTTSGPDGSFRFTVNVATMSDERRNSLSVGAFADGTGATRVFANAPELRADMTLWLPPEEVVSGRVIDPEGQPVAGVALTASLRDGRYRKTGQPVSYQTPLVAGDRHAQFLPDDPARERATTGPDGRFTIRGLSRDWLYEFDASSPTIVTIKAQIDARAVDQTMATGLPEGFRVVRYGNRIDLVAAPCKPITGTVREKDGGRSVAGVELQAFVRSPRPVATTTNAEGRYTLTGLPPGEHNLIVNPPANSPYIRGESKVDARTPGIAVVRHDIEIHRLPFAKGRVTDARTGRPVVGSVEYRPLAANPELAKHALLSGPDKGQRGPTARLDENGRYSLPVLPGGGALFVTAEGNYVPAALAADDRTAGVVCADDGELLDTRPLPVLPARVEAYRRIAVTGGTDVEIDFTLAPARRRPLVVTFPDGASRKTQVFGTSNPARVDRSIEYVVGETVIERLTPGEVRRVYASTHDGLLAGFLDVSGDADSAVELPLRPTAAVTGRVVEGGGPPAGSVGFVVAYDGGRSPVEVVVNGSHLARRWGPRDTRLAGFTSIRDLSLESTDVKAAVTGDFRVSGIVPGLAFDLHAIRYSPKDALGRSTFLGVFKLTRATTKAGETLALGELTPDGPATAAKPAATLNGQVFAPDGKPLAAARLTYLHGDETTPAGMTDADGRFALSPPPGTTAIAATADNFGINFDTVNTTEPMQLRTVKGHAIRGRVVDTQGKPVASVTVCVRHLAVHANESLDGFLTRWPTGPSTTFIPPGVKELPAVQRVFDPVTTDAAGRFVITGVGVERFAILGVSGPGLADAEVFVVNRPGFDPRPHNEARAAYWRYATADVRHYTLHGPEPLVVVGAEKPIRGVIRDADTGAPRPNVAVTVFGMMRSFATLKHTATTDAAGRFEFRGIGNAKSYSFQVANDAVTGHVGRIEIIDDTPAYEPLVANLAMKKGVVITGRVTDAATGRPVRCSAHADMLAGNPHAKEYASWLGVPYEFVSDDDGRYRVVATPGPVLLVVRAERPADVVYEMSLNDPDHPDYFRKDIRRYQRAGGAGEGHIAGEYCKVFDASAGAVVTHDIKLRPAARTPLRFVDAADRPVSGTLVFKGASPDILRWPGRRVAASTAEVYQLKPKTPRTLYAFEPTRRLFGLSTLAGDEAGPVTVKLNATGTATGRAVTEDGTPVRSARLRLLYIGLDSDFADECAATMPPVTTDANGAFRAEGVFVGRAFAVMFVGADGRYLPARESDQWTVDKADAPTNLGDVSVTRLR